VTLTLDLKFASYSSYSLVTLLQRYVSTKLELSTAYWKHGTDGQTDRRVATLSEGRVTTN